MTSIQADLRNYDLFPRVVIEGEPVTITIRPLGQQAAFDPEIEYRILVLPRNDRDYQSVTETRTPRVTELFKKPDADGCIRVPFTFWGEQAWFFRVFLPGEKKHFLRLALYCLHEDMRGRYPFLGDLHVHSSCSDGKEAPEIVAANLRKIGYDFTVISDHRRYYGSLDAIRAYEGVKHDMEIVPGEEVHMPIGVPNIFVHSVNFGGVRSVNGLVDSNIAYTERGNDPKWFALDGKNYPAPITEEEYTRQVLEIAAAQKDRPAEVDPFTHAALLWAYDRIREAGGVAILAHPLGLDRSEWSAPEALTRHLLRTHPFDALELFGGADNAEMDGQQQARYAEIRAEGIDFPVVGSSDSHGATDCNPYRCLGQTILFARKNERRALMDAVLGKYTVAIENNSKEFRLAGSFRFVQYGRFLLDGWFPMHAELCFEEGRLMKEYVLGDPDAKAQLEALSGRCEKLMKKYFAI